MSEEVKYLALNQHLYTYILANSLRENDAMRGLREETSQLAHSYMQVPSLQGQFIGLLVQLIGAKKTLEVGVFTGYSTLCTALALPPDGRVVACDTRKDWAQIGQKYWKQAGVAGKILLQIGPALNTMDYLLRNSQENSFDFVFIDADKENYAEYYERALKLVRPGGLIAIDNVLWEGNVADVDMQDSETNALRAFNEKLHSDQRVVLSLLPLFDGLTLALKCA